VEIKRVEVLGQPGQKVIETSLTPYPNPISTSKPGVMIHSFNTVRVA
jgi:hypothetical protein